jgi:hypothetical protein
LLPADPETPPGPVDHGGAAPPGSCVSMAGAGAGEASLAGPRSLRRGDGPSGVGEPPSGPAVCRQGLAEHRRIKRVLALATFWR